MGLRLQAEFKSDQGTDYTIQVYDDNYAGATQTVNCGPDGFTLSYENQNGKIYSTIVASRCKFTLFFEDATNEAFITDLLTSDEDDIKVKILKGTDIFWAGVVLADQVEHLDEYYPFAFEFTAVDGLGRLKTIDYANAGAYYSGFDTLWSIVQKCLDNTGVKDFWTASDEYIRTSLNYLEDTMPTGGDTNPLILTRVNQIIFRKNEEESNEPEFYSCYYVLEQILFLFGARIFQSNGSWWIISFNEFEDTGLRLIRYDKDGAYISHTVGWPIDVTIDQSTKARLKGVKYSYFPPLQEFKLLYKHNNVSNLLFGKEWNHNPIDFTNSELYEIGEVDDNDNQAKLKFTGTMEHIFQHIDTVDPPEPFFFGVFHFWRIELKVGSYYLRRNFLPFQSPFVVEFEDPIWTTTPSYYYIRSSYVFEPYVSFFDQIEFITPALPEQGEVTISLEYDSTYEENGNELDVDLGGTGSPPRILYYLPNPVLTLLADGTTANQEGTLVYLATNNVANNTLRDSFTVIMGDGPTDGSPGHLEVSADGATWEPSADWNIDFIGSTKKLGQLVAETIVGAQSYPIKKLNGTIFGTNIFPYNRLDINSEYYAFLGGSFDANLEHFSGEWYVADRDNTNVVVDEPAPLPPPVPTPPSSGINGGPPPGGGTSGYGGSSGGNPNGLNLLDVLDVLIEIQVGEGGTSAGGSGSIPLETPLETDLVAGQEITIIHPGTGATQTFTVAEDTPAGSTEIPVLETFIYSFPSGSYIIVSGGGTGGGGNTTNQVVQNIFNVNVGVPSGTGAGNSGCEIEAVRCSVERLELFACIDSGTNWSTGQVGPFYVVPSHFNGLNLSQVGVHIATLGSSGTGRIQIKVNGSVISTVDVSSQATNRAVYTITETALSTDDVITFNVSSVQTTPAQGLMIELFVDDSFVALKRFDVGLTGSEACQVMYLPCHRNSISAAQNYKRLVDSSNNDNRGKLYSGKALDFNGSSDFIDVGNTGESIKTIIFWCRPDSDTEKILDLDGGTTTVEIVSGTLTLSGFTAPTPYVNGINDNQVTANEWNMVAIVDSTAVTASNIEIGRVGASYYDGELTSLRLFSSALSASQINSLYTYPEAIVPGAAYYSSLKAFWSLDHVNANFAIALDSSGNGHHGTITGGTYTNALTDITPQQAFTDYSEVLYFNNNSYVSVADAATLDLTTTGTISVWFITKDITDAGFLVCKNASGTGFTLELSGSAAVLSGGGVTTTTSSALSSNTLYHIVATWDGTSAEIYVNGSSDATGTINAVGATANALTIGGDSGGANLAEALIFEVAVWNSVLTSANVTSLYNQVNTPDEVAAADLVGYWNNAGARTWTDLSGNGNDGTVAGTTETLYLPEGRSNDNDGFFRALTDVWPKVLKFNGDEYAIVDDSDTLDLTTAGSLYAWIRPSDVDSLQYVIEKAGAYYLRINADNTLTFALYSSSSATAFTTTQTVSADTWVFFAATYDGTNVKIYLDGTEVDSTAFSSTIDTNTNDLYIGRDAAGSNYLNGYVDEIALYNCAKTDSEILEFYIDTEPEHREVTLPEALFIGDPDADEIIGDPATDEGIGSNT